MKKMKISTIAIAILTMTAVLQFVGIARQDHHNLPVAMGSGMTAASGEYIVTVGSSSEHDEELVYVVNAGQQKLCTYRYNFNQRKLDFIQGLSLESLRQQAAPPPPPPGKGKPPKNP